MATLEDRFYERTIPEHGKGPELRIVLPIVRFHEMEKAIARVGEAMRSLAELLTPLDDEIQLRQGEIDLMRWVERRCAGHIRRQARVRR